jgi:tRNA nucleotidyltransferase (CCA-adding enzyme)
MAARTRTYPQVDVGAEELVDLAVVRVRDAATVRDALQNLRAQGAAVARVAGQWVLREDLNRAMMLGLGDLHAAELGRPLPGAPAHASEVVVRRYLARGAPAVVITSPRRTVGAVGMSPGLPAARVPLGPRFPERLDGPARRVLELAGRLARERCLRLFVVGGTVRDALRGSAPAVRDLDLVVEGDGLGLARWLAEAAGVERRALVEHTRFLTASVLLPAGGRVDIATARAERYERPGALPRVIPATIMQDLARRDFSVNAMAVEVTAPDFTLLDPHGGREDLRCRRLRALHPLSFVEDPTRIFRAARYRARLGFAVEAWTRRGVALAVRRAPYPALSGQRLMGELERMASDAHPDRALAWLGRVGGFRLLDPRYRFGRATAARVQTLPRALAWASACRLGVAPVELVLLALTAAQPADVRASVLSRLGLSGEPRARLERALRGADALRRALVRARRPSERARPLWDATPVELTWLWWTGGSAVRAGVEWFVATARGLRPELDGDAVAALGVPRGPALAEALRALRDARLDGQVRDRDEEADFVRRWLAREPELGPVAAARAARTGAERGGGGS